MKRSDYLKPDITDLKPESILPIYNKYTDEDDFVGNAKLIEYAPSWQEELNYIRAEIGGTENKMPITINWSYQRWLVEFIDGPMTGHRTHRYIAYFVCIDSYMTSGYDLYEE